MNEKSLMEIMFHASDSLMKSIEDYRTMFHNIDIDPDELNIYEAERIGIGSLYRGLKGNEAALERIKEAFDKLRNPKEWLVIRCGPGVVYVCPYCNKKQSDFGDYCCNCGERVFPGGVDRAER